MDAGRLGRKSGRGVFTYDDGRRPAARGSCPTRAWPGGCGRAGVRDPVARTLAMLVNEAIDLVPRGEASPEDVDIAMVLGTSYPAGPLEWGGELGLRRRPQVGWARATQHSPAVGTGRARPLAAGPG